jgi:hypothetical protein
MSKTIATRVPSRRLTAAYRATSAACTLTALSLLLSACATVTVKKVPTPTQYLEWTDAKQAEADAMEGLRFYLPRPYINVFESFPISTDIYFAEGTVSADGRFVVLDTIRSIDELNHEKESSEAASERIGARPSKEMKLNAGAAVPLPLVVTQNPSSEQLEVAPPRNVIAPYQSLSLPEIIDAVDKLPDFMKGPLEELLKKAAGGVGEGIGENIGEEIAKKAAELLKERLAAMFPGKSKEADKKEAQGDAEKPKSGINARAVTNDPNAFSYQPLRGNYDLLYLPDFEEQYVASSTSDGGNADMKLSLGQSWSLQGFNSVADNSEITKRVYSAVDAAVALAKNALVPEAAVAENATSKASMFEFMPKGILPNIRALNEEEIKAFQASASKITLRIVVVHYAAKGLYPVLKPREVAGGVTKPDDHFKSTAEFEAGTRLSTNLASPGNLRWERCVTDCEIVDDADSDHTIPVFPYQVVSFNTFQYMFIEALSPELSPDKSLYDKTGTTGEPGDRQTTDLSDRIKGGGIPVVVEPKKEPAPTPTEEQRKAFAKAIRTFVNKSDKDIQCFGDGCNLDKGDILVSVSDTKSLSITIRTGPQCNQSPKDTKAKVKEAVKALIGNQDGFKDVKPEATILIDPID